MMTNKSPLRYPGGKSRACKQLDTILNKHFNIKEFNTLVSPFFGGGSFEFYVQNKYSLNIKANDLFKPLCSFWLSCKNNNKLLCDELIKYLNKIDKEAFITFRKKIMDEQDTLTQGVMYFIINRCSFSGATLSGGFSLESSKKRFTQSSIDRVRNLNLTNFEMNNEDFETFIQGSNKNDELMFLDPPYYLEKGSKLYGDKGDIHTSFDHDRLYNYIKSRKNWMMTYNNCDYIKSLYKDYKIIEVDWSYGMNKSKQSSEIVIIGSGV